MRNIFRLQRIKDISISKKLYFIVGIMAVLIILELLILGFAIRTLSSVRALVGAEGLWSKAQKDAVYHLEKYTRTQDIADYNDFKKFMAVPLGDHKTRLELLKKVPDMEVARQGFKEGRIHEDDIDGMIYLLRRFHRIYYIKQAILYWTQGDIMIERLIPIAEEMHREISSGNPNEARMGELVLEIDKLNADLTVLEDNFSYILGEGSRWLENLVLKLLFAVALTVEITGISLSIYVSHGITKGLNEINRATSNIKRGKLDDRAAVFSNDEIGQVATALNQMTEQLAISHNELEEHQRRLLEAQEIAELGSFEWDLNGGKSLFSPQLLKIFELEKPGSLDSFIQYVHPSDHKKLRDAIENAIKGNGQYQCEYRYKKGTKEKTLWSRGVVIYENGTAKKMQGTVMDVTERHDTLKKLERSEELHKQAQALTHLGNWSWNMLDNKIEWSDEMYRIYGLEPGSEEITFERFISMVHPEDRNKREDEIRAAVETGIAEEYTMRIICPDKTVKVLQGKSQVMLDENGKAIKLVGTCQDVTRQAIMNRQLKENEETFRQLISNAPDAVIVIDKESKILLWNPQAEAIFGWKAEDVISKSLTDTIIPPVHRDNHMNGIKRLNETGESRVLNKALEMTALNKSGKEFFISLSIAKSIRAGQEVFISFIRDISKEKKAEMELERNRNELAKKNMELVRSNEELMAFNYIASHDLQEPVRKIKTFANRIVREELDGLPENTKTYLERILNSADHMQNLIQALLAYSRTSSVESTFEPVDLNEMLETVKDSLRESIEEKNAVITSTRLPTLNFIPYQVQQLLENFISNSLKYSRDGERPSIHVSSDTVPGSALDLEGADRSKTYTRISIQDNGIGFEEQYSSKIFDLFQRLHAKDAYSGTGIGLAICKKIVQNHNGLISAESTPGVGSTFYIYLPQTSVKEAAATGV